MTAEIEPNLPVPVAEPARAAAGTRWLIRAGMVVAVLGWLWPIGVGGMMPVGGDTTQFTLGLMAFLGDSLRGGRWPLWNDLWGFGFPGLAESQMGVYYPPHWAHAFLSAESAYTASLVLHFLWGALGAGWLARRLGVSEAGSALTGFAWATSGFFLIHLPHYWAYTVGSWMPWVWGLAWVTLTAERPGPPARWLAAALAVQILPGHFQMAFTTEVGAVGLTLAALVASPVGLRWRGVAGVLGALVAALPLAALQLVPTLMLARLAGASKGFEYLAGFAVSPVHLVSYVAPWLWHRSPLWRPLAWDLFRTAPEEYLGYVGLVPLLLANWAVVRLGRSVPAVRVLILLGLMTVALSFGPYFPGFRALILVPGFSFFRAPARWSLATALVLATLAGFGFDQVARRGIGRREIIGFAAATLGAVGVVVGTIELALAATRGAGWPAAIEAFDGALRLLPWADGSRTPAFALAMRSAHRPQDDLRVQIAQARLDGRLIPPGGLILEQERGSIYRRELAGTGLCLAALVGVGLMAGRRPRLLAGAFGALTVVDLIGVGQARPFDLGPIRSAVAQSPILGRVAAGPRGLRTIDPAQNLFMAAGGDTAEAYRTLTLPAPAAWLNLARGLDPDRPEAAAALRALGIDARVLAPREALAVPPGWRANGWGATATTVRDPVLASWLLGADYARLTGLDAFRWIAPAAPGTRAWRFERRAIEAAGVDPLRKFGDATPLAWRSARPRSMEVDWVADPTAPPAAVVLAVTYDPEWVGTWVGPDGATRPAVITPAFEGWQAIGAGDLPAGRWTLRLEYAGRAARAGLAIAAVGWAAWLVLMVRGWVRRPRGGEQGGEA